MSDAISQGPARIRPLDPVTVSQIAAGEVVERPASVLRELLDNALDSGATRISIEVDQGGIDRILVVDNGTGILPDDLTLALSSHATSKLHNAGELEHITSMGFRGEALASIASVSRLSLESHPPGRDVGGRIRCEGGQASEIEPWGGAPGTRVEVRHLFYNAPVRRRFLKSQAAEMAQLNEVFNRFALAIAAIPPKGARISVTKAARKPCTKSPATFRFWTGFPGCSARMSPTNCTRWRPGAARQASQASSPTHPLSGPPPACSTCFSTVVS